MRQPVKVGLVSAGKAEILEGLKAGDLVIPATSTLNEGAQDQGAACAGPRAMNHWTPFEWITALRFLKEGRMQTMFIVTAVAIGVAVIVFMSAMLSSLQANFIKRVLTSQPHIQLIPPDEVARPLRPVAPGRVVAAIVQRPSQRIRSIDQWQKIRAQLSEWPDIVTVSPTMSSLRAGRTGRCQAGRST